MRWLGVLVLAACGGSARPAPEPARPTGPTCAAASDGMVAFLTANKDPKPPDDAVDKLRNLIRQRCTLDAWSPEAQRCLADMKTADDANVCGTLLSDDQQAALVKAQAQSQP